MPPRDAALRVALADDGRAGATPGHDPAHAEAAAVEWCDALADALCAEQSRGALTPRLARTASVRRGIDFALPGPDC